MTTIQYAKKDKYITGSVRRDNDKLTHLGPPLGYDIPTNSLLFATRCQLESKDGNWYYVDESNGKYCYQCAINGGLIFEIGEIIEP